MFQNGHVGFRILSVSIDRVKLLSNKDRPGEGILMFNKKNSWVAGVFAIGLIVGGSAVWGNSVMQSKSDEPHLVVGKELEEALIGGTFRPVHSAKELPPPDGGTITLFTFLKNGDFIEHWSGSEGGGPEKRISKYEIFRDHFCFYKTKSEIKYENDLISENIEYKKFIVDLHDANYKSCSALYRISKNNFISINRNDSRIPNNFFRDIGVGLSKFYKISNNTY